MTLVDKTTNLQAQPVDKSPILQGRGPMTEREAFEHHTGLSWEYTDNLTARTQWARAWQASRKQALEEAAALCLAPDGRDVGMTGANCATAIRSLTPTGEKA